MNKKWIVKFHEDFEPEFEEPNNEVQDELFAHALLLEEFGPKLGRPSVDTLKRSKFRNLKELRFKANNGVWRVAFVFDPKREVILLIAGNKAGVSEKRFYNDLIRKAEERISKYLKDLRGDPYGHYIKK